MKKTLDPLYSSIRASTSTADRSLAGFYFKVLIQFFFKTIFNDFFSPFYLKRVGGPTDPPLDN